jgi:hypothetical protein
VKLWRSSKSAPHFELHRLKDKMKTEPIPARIACSDLLYEVLYCSNHHRFLVRVLIRHI